MEVWSMRVIFECVYGRVRKGLGFRVKENNLLFALEAVPCAHARDMFCET